METVTISKAALTTLLCDVILTENDIDMFLSDNYEAIRFSLAYLNAKDRFNVVVKQINNMIEK